MEVLWLNNIILNVYVDIDTVLKLEYTFFKYACWLVLENKKKYAEKWLGDSKPKGACVTESKENVISLFHDTI